MDIPPDIEAGYKKLTEANRENILSESDLRQILEATKHATRSCLVEHPSDNWIPKMQVFVYNPKTKKTEVEILAIMVPVETQEDRIKLFQGIGAKACSERKIVRAMSFSLEAWAGRGPNMSEAWEAKDSHKNEVVAVMVSNCLGKIVGSVLPITRNAKGEIVPGEWQDGDNEGESVLVKAFWEGYALKALGMLLEIANVKEPSEAASSASEPHSGSDPGGHA
jgi:hypothetical protein